MHRPGTTRADGALSISDPPGRPGPLDLEGTALFLDLDGTLAPISPRPQDVRPDDRRTRLLQALDAALGGRLAVVSGRTLADVDRILGGAVATVAGVHGLERRLGGGPTWRAAASPTLGGARAAFEAVVRACPGVTLEDKGLSLAVHYRAAPSAIDAVRKAAEAVAADSDLTLQWGDMVAELRTPGPDKGDAISAFMAAPPFEGSRPVFVGDDLTDEHGFAAAAACGGFGVLVGPVRPTAARARLPNVEAVRDWLTAAVAGTGAA